MRNRYGLFLVLAVIAGGCNDNRPITAHPVEGQVLYKGAPAAGVKVYFYPTSAPGVPLIPAHPHGITGPDGRFTLTTFDKDDGAPEGGYQVILLWPPVANEEAEEEEGDRLFGWYDARHSKLTANVKSGPNDLPPFKLAAVTGPPPVSEGVPGRN